MKKHLKKTLILLISIVLMFSLAACSFITGPYDDSQQSTEDSNIESNENDNSITTDNSQENVDPSPNSQNNTNSTNSQNYNSVTNSNVNNSTNSANNSTSSTQISTSGSDTTAFVSCQGVSEAATIIWKDTAPTSAKVYYANAGTTNWTQIDNELIRATSSSQARADIVGLKAGKYDFRVVIGASNKDFVCKDVSVSAYDRSGYAHFNYSNGVGAYKDDGTLKSGITVKYITQATKNNLASSINSNTCIRIIGQIATNTQNSSGAYYGNYGKMTGLSEKNSNDDNDYYNMLFVNSKTNFTIEGIGDNAECYQWGMTFKKCKYFEVRNLAFTNYPEDACAVEGSSSSSDSERIWIHNNQFNRGKNEHDVTPEKDKYAGDGAIDIKWAQYATYSYNYVYNCKKTGLVGGADTHQQYHITFHHNYFNKCEQRTPLGRQANIHYYNNLFQSASSYVMSLRANAYAFVEGCMVKSCSSFRDSKTGGVCKSYNNTFSSTSKGNITEVTDRTKTVSSSNKYANFDTNNSVFYYDSTNKVSKVTYLSSAAQAETDCIAAAGRWKANIGTGETSSESGTSGGNTETNSSSKTSSQTSTVNSTGNSTASTIGELVEFNTLSSAGSGSVGGFTANNCGWTTTSGKTCAEINHKFTVGTIKITSNGSTNDKCIIFTAPSNSKKVQFYINSTSADSGTKINLTKSNGSSAQNFNTTSDITVAEFNITAGTSYVLFVPSSGSANVWGAQFFA